MKFVHFILVFCLINLGFLAHASAAGLSAINELLDEDNYRSLEELRESYENHENNIKILSELEARLSQINSHKPIYLQTDKVVGGVVIAGLLFASYHVFFPPTLRVLLTSFFAVKLQSHGTYKLTMDQIKKLTSNVSMAKLKLQRSKLQLDLKRKYYCQTNVPHLLCRI